MPSHRLLYLALAPLVACTDAEPDDTGLARALLAQVEADDYRSWSRAPGYPGRMLSTAPHSKEVEVFVNETVVAALESSPSVTSWPVGSVIVKEGWNGDDLAQIALMEKRLDGWFWVEFHGEDPAFVGAPRYCTRCHETGDDFVLTFRFEGER
jgi:hypothetical protein